MNSLRQPAAQATPAGPHSHPLRGNSEIVRFGSPHEFSGLIPSTLDPPGPLLLFLSSFQPLGEFFRRTCWSSDGSRYHSSILDPKVSLQNDMMHVLPG